MPTLRSLGAVSVACAALAALPAAASADSLVFLKDANVWVSNPDGSSPYQVTLDGTADRDYFAPSMADDGTIVVGRGTEVLRLTQGGNELSRFTPRSLTDSANGTTTGQPRMLDVSPDGTKVAYALASYTCNATVDCMARATLGVADAAGNLLPGQPGLYGGTPQWLDDARLVFHGGYGSHNLVWTVGAPEPFHWFDDHQVFGQEHSTDLADGALSRDGRRYVQLRGYGATTHLIWYDVPSGVAPETPPTPLCESGNAEELRQPAISGDGQTVFWTENTGVWAKPNAGTCTDPQPALLIPGASDPDWSPAPLAPDARRAAPAPGAPSPGPGSGGGTTPASAGGATTPAAKPTLAKVTRGKRAVALRLTCPKRCTYTAKLLAGRRTIATKQGTARAGRATTISLRHRGRSGLKVSVTAGGQTVTAKVKG